MKVFTDTNGNKSATFRLVVQCLNRLRYGAINCKKKENNFLVFCTTKYTLLCLQWPTIILCITVDVCMSNHNIYHF